MNGTRGDSNNRVLVTGGGGYIGSHACKVLAKAGYEPVVYDNLVYGHDWAVKWGPLEVGDIADQVRLKQVFEKYQPFAVMHFAAYAYVGESVETPGKYYRNNVAGSLSLLEVMSEQRVDKLVFSSTCATYGEPQQIPIGEDHPQQPINPYGMSKLIVERMLADFGRANGTRSISLRYFNAAGADPDGEIGELHDPETHLIPLVLDVAKGQRTHVTIFGDDYETADGTCVRDYIHVTDLAQAHVLALNELKRNSVSSGEVSNHRAFNLGNGAGFSVKEIVRIAEKVTGRSIPVEIGSRRAGDPPVLVGDSSKIQNVLGWRPQLADLETIVESAWKWSLVRDGFEAGDCK